MKETTLTIDSIEDFRRWLSEKGRSANTTKAYCSDVAMFFKELELDCLQVRDLPALVAEWMNKQKRFLAPKTSRRRLASLREFGVWAGQANLLPKFKLPSSGSTVAHPLPGLEDDLQKMLDGCKTDMQRALIALLGLEGMRLHEALDLNVPDLNLQEMTIKVWGKGDKTRIIPITNRAWDYLAPRIISAMLAHSPKLISYSDRGARTFITELGAAVGISRPVASHDLRSTFATLAYNSCQDILLVQGWLGHADVNTTQGYIGTKMEDMRRAGEF